jgi:hypothetical protein
VAVQALIQTGRRADKKALLEFWPGWKGLIDPETLSLTAKSGAFSGEV